MLSALTSLLGRWRATCLAGCFGIFDLVRRLFLFLSSWSRVGLGFSHNLLPIPEADEHDLPEARWARITQGRLRRLNDKGYARTTEDETIDIVEAFVNSVDEDAVGALASRFNNGVPCHVVSKLRGSFNCCFFVEFDNQDGETTPKKWVVRLPISHTVAQPWPKVLSEVTTMRYLQQNTNIPIPRVHAFGREASLIRKKDAPADTANSAHDSGSETGIDTDGHSSKEAGQIFIIMDFVAGDMLDRKLLTTADPEARRGFYLQLIGILAQLRKLEFPRMGSLTPRIIGTADILGVDECRPQLGPMLSMSDNILCLPLPPVWTAVADYMAHSFNVVSEFFFDPTTHLTPETTREELFALASLKPLFLGLADNVPNGPFILNHGDLRSTNMIVDDNLRIQAIIDWEFATTVPLPLFTPPSWITGHNDDTDINPIVHTEFREALHALACENASYRALEIEWYGDASDPGAQLTITSTLSFCIAHILRRPSEAVEIFYKFLANINSDGVPGMTDEEKKIRITKYFEDHPDEAIEAERRYQQAQDYTNYLSNNGLYETREDRIDDTRRKIREFLDNNKLK